MLSSFRDDTLLTFLVSIPHSAFWSVTILCFFVFQHLIADYDNMVVSFLSIVLIFSSIIMIIWVCIVIFQTYSFGNMSSHCNHTVTHCLILNFLGISRRGIVVAIALSVLAFCMLSLCAGYAAYRRWKKRKQGTLLEQNLWFYKLTMMCKWII